MESPYYYCGGVLICLGAKGQRAQTNRAAQSKACAESVNMKKLSLTINVKVHAEFRSLEWIKAFIRVRSFEHLTLQAKGPCRTCMEFPSMELPDKRKPKYYRCGGNKRPSGKGQSVQTIRQLFEAELTPLPPARV